MWAYRGAGVLVVSVAVHVFVPGLYVPPVLMALPETYPPQTTISLPVQTAVCEYRLTGALVLLVAVHAFVLGLYRPPVPTLPG